MTNEKEYMRKYQREWRAKHPGYKPNTDASIRKSCTKCKQEKPATVEFFGKEKTRPLGLTSQCRECQTKRCSAYNKANRERVTARSKEWRQRTRSQRKYTLRYGYGLTVEQYDAILNAQGGVCAICSAPPEDAAKRRLAVDHDHKTDRNRGLLCTCCNHALERIENDPDWGIKALNYLARFIEQTVSN